MQDRVWRKCRHLRVWCPQKPWWMSPPFPNHQIAPPKSRKLGFPSSEYCTRTRHIAGSLSIAALQIAFCAPFVLQHMASPYWLSRWELCQNELDFGRCLCQEMVFPKPYHNLFSWNRSTLNKSYIHSVFCQSENVDGKLISLRGTGPLRFSAKFSSMPVISKSMQSWEDEQKVSVCKTNKHQVHCSSLWLSLLDGLCWNICQVGKVDDDFIVGGGDLIFWQICPR